MIRKTFHKLTKTSTTILLSSILLGITFTGGNMPTAFADDLCGTTIVVDTVLTHPQNCTDATGGITIGANDVKLDLNGWDINCTGAGYLGSCQGTGAIGVDQDGWSGMTVVGPGSINGFTIGVLVDAPLANVHGLFITGPPAPGLAGNQNPRPAGQHGIRIVEINCPGDLETTESIHHNEIENHTEGIAIIDSNCVNVHHNEIHDNNSDPIECSGIVMIRSDNNKIHDNTISDNGENLGQDAGIILYDSDNNKIYRNLVFDNNGAGISLRTTSTGNVVSQNEVFNNLSFGGDLSIASGAKLGTGTNNWDKNCFGTTNVVPAPTPAKKCPIKNAGA